MDASRLEHLAVLRAVVGFLGEKSQHHWWASAFFAPESDAFLSPVFPRTEMLARCHGATQAAALVHDVRIGVGRVFHLFRLPEDMELGIHEALHDKAVVERIEAAVANTEAATSFLRESASEEGTSGKGPVSVGASEDLRDSNSWGAVAEHYATAFGSGTMIFPFFTDKE